MSDHLWKIAVITFVASVAIASPSLATAQTRAQEVHTKSAGRSSKAITNHDSASRPIIATATPIVLLLLQQGGTIAITSSVIAGGGGSATGGSFSLNGTIGQPAAGAVMTAPNFSVASGFWAADVVPPPFKKRRGQITSQD